MSTQWNDGDATCPLFWADDDNEDPIVLDCIHGKKFMKIFNVLAFSLCGLLSLQINAGSLSDEARTSDESNPNIAITTHHVEPPYVEQKRAEHEKYMMNVKEKAASMGELEQLAVESLIYPPAPSRVAQYQGANIENLEAMLSDNDFIKHWGPIAKTIGMVADRASIERLIRFIKSDSDSHENIVDFNNARFAAFYGLRYYLVRQADQDTLGFLIGMMEKENVKKLNFSGEVTVEQIVAAAEGGLAFIATDAAIAALEKRRTELMKIASSPTTQILNKDERAKLENQEKWLDRIINDAQRKQAGLPKEPPKDGDPIP